MSQLIASEIRESGQLSNYRVGVKYQDGVAWLFGSVTDKGQEAKAVDLAKQVAGVEHVVSRLEVGSAKASATKPARRKATTKSMPRPTKQSSRTPAPTQVAESSNELLLELLDDTPSPEAVGAPNRADQAKYEPKPLEAPVAAVKRAAPLRTARRQQPRGAQMPTPFARTAPGGGQQPPVRPAQYGAQYGGQPQGYVPAGGRGGAQGVSYDSPNMPGYAWPSYASHPNYSAVTYPKQYSPTAWPYIGPFYPYPQVPLGWRKVALEWDDGWWHLDFSHHQRH
ncbi:MAG: BON domain-containing protein [Planctomycetota bacterium]